MRATRVIILLVGLVLLMPTTAHAANRTDYPHKGEVVGYADTSSLVFRSNVRPRSLVIGDSIAYGARHALRAAGYRGEISAVPGRDVGNLPAYIKDRYDTRRERRRATNLIIPLGTNATPGWTYDNLANAVRMVPAKVKITFVTTWRDPVRYSDAREPYRGRASVQATYSRWMKVIAGWRPKTAVADWRAFVIANPSAAPDGVHPSGWGANSWAQRVMQAVRWGR